ncbi:hypothetical protein EDD85DRAFT_982013 [Armillaria nabsnona]|nr:hypothetical protein EDD85DRAFT_982013 [Armillaria nabsnona]
MGKRQWILWTFFGLLVCSTATSILVSLQFFMGTAGLLYVIPTLIFEVVIFVSTAYHAVKQSGVFQGSALYFIVVLGSLPVMGLLDARLGITINHMLLHLRKQGLSDTVGPSSQGVELMTLRATANRAMSLEVGENVISIRPFPQGR